MTGKVEQRLMNAKKAGRPVIFALVDPQSRDDLASVELLGVTIRDLDDYAEIVVLAGGSSANDKEILNGVKRQLGGAAPLVLFPGNITGVVSGADAILFTSLLNSENPYYITQAQALGAPIVKKYNLEAIPTAYLIIGEGTSVWFYGYARAIPLDKPDIAVTYALAGQYLGMRFIYLEAGSGAKKSVTPKMVKAVRRFFDGFIIVGGGIKDGKKAKSLIKAGADGLVIGTLLEQTGGLKKFTEIIKSVRK